MSVSPDHDKRVLIHIGAPKTGSTSIQLTLKRHREILAQRGVVYPVSISASHNQIAQLLWCDPSEWQRGMTSRFAPDEVDSLMASYGTPFRKQLASHDRAILSGELLLTFEDHQIQRLRDDLQRFGYNRCQVVAYVRDPASYYMSLVQQRLKASDRYPAAHHFRTNFAEHLARWERWFPGCVTVRHFDRNQLRDGCAVADLAALASSFLECDVRAALTRIERTNESISAEAAIVLQNYRHQVHRSSHNRFTGDTDALIDIMQALHADGRVKQTKAVLAPRLADMIRFNHRDDLVALRDRWSINLTLHAPSLVRRGRLSLVRWGARAKAAATRNHNKVQKQAGRVALRLVGQRNANSHTACQAPQNAGFASVRNILAAYDEQIVERLMHEVIHHTLSQLDYKKHVWRPLKTETTNAQATFQAAAVDKSI